MVVHTLLKLKLILIVKPMLFLVRGLANCSFSIWKILQRITFTVRDWELSILLTMKVKDGGMSYDVDLDIQNVQLPVLAVHTDRTGGVPNKGTGGRWRDNRG